jgi:hypothetical protein
VDTSFTVSKNELGYWVVIFFLAATSGNPEIACREDESEGYTRAAGSLEKYTPDY